MIVNAKVLRVERVSGENKDEGRTWNYLRATVLDLDTMKDVFQARVADDWPADQPLVEGQDVMAVCAVSPYVRNGRAELSVRLDSPFNSPKRA